MPRIKAGGPRGTVARDKRLRKLEISQPIETEVIPVELEFKRKDGSIVKVPAKKIVRKRISSKKVLSASNHGKVTKC